MNKKIKILMMTISSVLVVSGCGTSDNGVEDALGKGSTENIQIEEADQEELSGIKVVGQVVEVFGNEITVQIGTMMAMNGNGGASSGGMRNQGLGEDAIPEGEMPEGVEAGTRPEGMEEGARSEGMEEGARPEGMEEGTRPEGMTQGGGTNGMSGAVAGSSETMDMSEVIQLTQEEVVYTIPVGTPVEQYGTEMTFSQITEDMYLLITTDEGGSILAIEIMG